MRDMIMMMESPKIFSMNLTHFFLHRYFHHLLFYSMFLPLDEKWAIDSKQSGKVRSPSFVSFGTITFKLFIMWLYWDAG